MIIPENKELLKEKESEMTCEDYLAIAMEHIDKCRRQEALEAFQQAADLDPNNYLAFKGLGEVNLHYAKREYATRLSWPLGSPERKRYRKSFEETLKYFVKSYDLFAKADEGEGDEAYIECRLEQANLYFHIAECYQALRKYPEATNYFTYASNEYKEAIWTAQEHL